MISIIFKNNTVIRILAIELLNTILLLIFSDKISLKMDGVSWQFDRLVWCALSWKMLKSYDLEECLWEIFFSNYLETLEAQTSYTEYELWFCKF
jgi:hypothetical protein